MVEAVVFLVFLGIFYGLSWLMGRIVFSALYEPTLLFQVTARFRISDVMVLALHVQLGLALLMGVARNSRPTDSEILAEMAFAGGNFIVLVTFWWLNGLRMLGRGGVNNTWHRWAFLGLVVPIGYICGITAISSVFLLPVSISSAIQYRDIEDLVVTLLFCLSWPGLYLIHRLSRKFVRQARHDRAEEDGIHFESETVFAPSPTPPRQHRPYRR